MKMERKLLPIAMALAVAGLGTHAIAMTQSDDSAHVVRATVDGHRYESGGYGEDQVAAMRRDADSYDLRMTFSAGKHNVYAAGLDLRIEDRAGRQVFAYDDAGPLTYVDLPAGHYRVVAEYEGTRRTADVEVEPGGHTNLNMHWIHAEG
jgi:hypothetical protein